MSGLGIGFLIGPPLGGVLNEKLGYRAPFCASIIVCFLDLIGRLLVVEKSVAKPWLDASRNQSGILSTEATEAREKGDGAATGGTNATNGDNATNAAGESNKTEVDATTQVEHESDANGDEEKPRSQLSVIKVLITLSRSRRCSTVLVNVFVYG
jgi:MFS family permease